MLRYLILFFTFELILSAYSNVLEHRLEKIQLNDGSIWKVKIDEEETEKD